MRSPLRLVYRAILCLHPHSFRAEFGDEMLWIFDEECQRGAGKLLVDGALSAVRQHAKDQDENEPVAAGFTVGIATSGMSLRRFVQGGVLACLIAYGLLLLMGRNGVVPVHAAVHSCTPVVYAPSRISYPPKPSGR